MTIDEYIEDQGQDVNATDLCVLGAFSGRLLEKLKETNANDYPGLREAVHVIIRVLESAAAQQAKDPLPRWLAETGFAAGYFLKRYDLIPDHLPEIGLADDALILQRVVERNQLELHRSLANASISPQATAAITEITKQGLGIIPPRAPVINWSRKP